MYKYFIFTLTLLSTILIKSAHINFEDNIIKYVSTKLKSEKAIDNLKSNYPEIKIDEKDHNWVNFAKKINEARKILFKKLDDENSYYFPANDQRPYQQNYLTDAIESNDYELAQIIAICHPNLDIDTYCYGNHWKDFVKEIRSITAELNETNNRILQLCIAISEIGNRLKINKEKDNTCLLCLDEIDNKEIVLTCGHDRIHKNCIEQILLNVQASQTCPICRKKIINKSRDNI